MIETQPGIPSSKHKPSHWMVWAIVLTCVLWISAVALPVWDTRSDHTGDWDVVFGFLPALLGFLGLFAMCPAWFANLLLIPICVMLFKGRKWGFVLSLVALAIAASAYALPGIYGDNDEAVIEGRRVGFYLWLGSFITLAFAQAMLAPAIKQEWIMMRVAVVALMALGIFSLERVFPVGVSPLESALKDPNDVTGLTTVLASHPPQAHKDTALHWAMRQDLAADRDTPSQQIIMLLAAGASPNQSTNGYIPIMAALGRTKDSVALVALLVKSGADVNAREEDGETVLMEALPPYGSEALVELLVKAGADVNAKDKNGKTALDIVKAREKDKEADPECEKFLVSAGARAGH